MSFATYVQQGIPNCPKLVRMADFSVNLDRFVQGISQPVIESAFSFGAASGKDLELGSYIATPTIPTPEAVIICSFTFNQTPDTFGITMAGLFGQKIFEFMPSSGQNSNIVSIWNLDEVSSLSVFAGTGGNANNQIRWNFSLQFGPGFVNQSVG